VKNLLMFKPTLRYHHLLVLREIRRDPKASQRSLARAAGVSAAMVNFYLAQFFHGKAVATTGKTNRTTRYELTPRGELYLAAFENELAEDLRILAAAARGRRA
jgi:predicted transcriptional regulator